MPAQIPAVIRFLGYVPFTHDGTVGGRTRWLRVCAGWTQEELAAAVGCEESTVWRWETNQPFDEGRWSRGIDAMKKRLGKLGISKLAFDDPSSARRREPAGSIPTLASKCLTLNAD